MNVAIGGDFLDGPDPWDNWNYPDAEMWFDSVKWYEYTGGDNNGPPIGEDGMECKAKDSASDGDLCGNAKWACYDQSHCFEKYGYARYGYAKIGVSLTFLTGTYPRLKKYFFFRNF